MFWAPRRAQTSLSRAIGLTILGYASFSFEIYWRCFHSRFFQHIKCSTITISIATAITITGCGCDCGCGCGCGCNSISCEDYFCWSPTLKLVYRYLLTFAYIVHCVACGWGFVGRARELSLGAPMLDFAHCSQGGPCENGVLSETSWVPKSILFAEKHLKESYSRQKGESMTKNEVVSFLIRESWKKKNRERNAGVLEINATVYHGVCTSIEVRAREMNAYWNWKHCGIVCKTLRPRLQINIYFFPDYTLRIGKYARSIDWFPSNVSCCTFMGLCTCHRSWDRYLPCNKLRACFRGTHSYFIYIFCFLRASLRGAHFSFCDYAHFGLECGAFVSIRVFRSIGCGDVIEFPRMFVNGGLYLYSNCKTSSRFAWIRWTTRRNEVIPQRMESPTPSSTPGQSFPLKESWKKTYSVWNQHKENHKNWPEHIDEGPNT